MLSVKTLCPATTLHLGKVSKESVTADMEDTGLQPFCRRSTREEARDGTPLLPFRTNVVFVCSAGAALKCPSQRRGEDTR